MVPYAPLDHKKLNTLTDAALAREINTRLPKIEAAIYSAREHANLALKVAIEIGTYLNEAKRRAPKGHWLVWLQENCPDISQPTAYRYMGLARKLSHVINRKTDMTIRQAYIACGILPDEPPGEKDTPNLDHAPAFASPDFLAQVRSVTQHVQAFQDLPFDTLDSPILDQLTEEWQAMIDVCNRLIEKAAAGRQLKQAKAAVVPALGKRVAGKKDRRS